MMKMAMKIMVLAAITGSAFAAAAGPVAAAGRPPAAAAAGPAAAGSAPRCCCWKRRPTWDVQTSVVTSAFQFFRFYQIMIMV